MKSNIFFDIESEQKILSFCNNDNIPIWFFMRRLFFEEISTRVFKDTSVKVVRKNDLSTIKYLVRCLVHNIIFSLTTIKKARVVFYTISREVIIDEKYFNQYTDDYAQIIPNDSITIEHPPIDWKWKYPRHNKKLLFSGPIIAFTSFIGRKTNIEDGEIVKLGKYLQQFVEVRYNISLSDEIMQDIIDATRYEMVRSKLQAKWLTKICKKYHAKCLIMLGASYSWYFYINKILKENGIKVADLQHGWISRSNNVYNYSNLVAKCKVLKCGIPNYFLTYGDLWKTQTNIPYDKIISLGNPFHEKMRDRFQKKSSDCIVLIGCSRNTKGYLELAEWLSEKLPNYKIIFRPHPTERYETKLLSENIHGKFIIDCEYDLYELLEETKILISEISTVLFEAVGLVDQIFVWRTKHSEYSYPDPPFETFYYKEELLAKIDNVKCQTIDGNFIWDKNWKDNFNEFYQELLY